MHTATSLTAEQKAVIARSAALLPLAMPTIDLAGGSVRSRMNGAPGSTAPTTTTSVDTKHQGHCFFHLDLWLSLSRCAALARRPPVTHGHAYVGDFGPDLMGGAQVSTACEAATWSTPVDVPGAD